MRRFLLAVLIAVPLAFTGAQNPKTYQVGRIETRLGEILFVLYDEKMRRRITRRAS